MERSPLLRWLLGFRWFRERLLVDDLFLAKLAMEMGVGMIAKVLPAPHTCRRAISPSGVPRCSLPPFLPPHQSLDGGGAVGLRREDGEEGWSCGDGHTEGAGSMPERHPVCSGAAVQS